MVPTTDLAAQLRQHRFFATLPGEMVERMAGCTEPRDYPAGHELMTAGRQADTMFAVKHGRLAVGVHAPGKGLVTLETVQAGEIVGWSWLFPPYRTTFDVVSVTPVSGLLLHAACIRPYLDEDPVAGLELMRNVGAVMEDRLESAGIRLLDLYGTGDADPGGSDDTGPGHG